MRLPDFTVKMVVENKDLSDLKESYEKVRKLVKENCQNDEKEEPFRAKYEAREILCDMNNHIQGILSQNRNEEEATQLLSGLQSIVQLILGRICIDLEELNTAEIFLNTSLDLLSNYESKKEFAIILLTLYNQMGILLSKKDTVRALDYLTKADLFYTNFKNSKEVPILIGDLFEVNNLRDTDKAFKKLENLHTLTYFYLAQIYANTERLKSSVYYHHTLKRQLNYENFEHVDWALSCASLSQFLIEKNCFKQARHHLAAATYILDAYKKNLDKIQTNLSDLNSAGSSFDNTQSNTTNTALNLNKTQSETNADLNLAPNLNKTQSETNASLNLAPNLNKTQTETSASSNLAPNLNKTQLETNASSNLAPNSNETQSTTNETNVDENALCNLTKTQLKTNEINKEQLEAKLENYNNRKADLNRCWIKYCCLLLNNSKERLMQENPSEITTDYLSSNVDNIPDDLLSNFEFETLDLGEYENKITCDFLLVLEDAKKVFIFGKNCVENAQIYYSFKTLASDYMDITQDYVKLYESLIFFDGNPDNQCKYHKRCVDLMENVVKEINPVYYMDYCRVFWFGIAQNLMEMMSIKADKLKECVDRPNPQVLSKINSLIDKSVAFFEKFLTSFKNCEFDKVPEHLQKNFLLVYIYIGALHGRFITYDKKVQLARNELSYSAYKTLWDLNNKNEVIKDIIPEELVIVKEMVTLLPLKKEKLVKTLV